MTITWSELGFDDQTSSEWEAAGLSPEDAREWLDPDQWRDSAACHRADP